MLKMFSKFPNIVRSHLLPTTNESVSLPKPKTRASFQPPTETLPRTPRKQRERRFLRVHVFVLGSLRCVRRLPLKFCYRRAGPGIPNVAHRGLLDARLPARTPGSLVALLLQPAPPTGCQAGQACLVLGRRRPDLATGVHVPMRLPVSPRSLEGCGHVHGQPGHHRWRLLTSRPQGHGLL